MGVPKPTLVIDDVVIRIRAKFWFGGLIHLSDNQSIIRIDECLAEKNKKKSIFFQ